MLEQAGMLEENFSHQGTTGRVPKPIYTVQFVLKMIKRSAKKIIINTFKELRNKTEMSSHK